MCVALLLPASYAAIESLSNNQPLWLWLPASCQPSGPVSTSVSTPLSQPHAFKLSPSLLLPQLSISLFDSPAVIYVVVSMEPWLGAKGPPPRFQEIYWTTPAPLSADL